MFRKYLIICISMLIALSACGQTKKKKQEEKEMEKIQTLYQSAGKDRSKSVYYCCVESKDCQYRIYIDDVLVFDGMGKNASSGLGLPINAAMLRNGTHRYTVKMYPEQGQPLLGSIDTLSDGEKYLKVGFVQIELFYSPKYDIRKRTSIGVFKSSDGDDGHRVVAALPRYEFSGEFEAVNLPAECEGWSNSLDLDSLCGDQQAKDALKQELYEKYKQLHTIIGSGDVDRLIDALKQREQLLDAMLCFEEQDVHIRSRHICNIIGLDDGLQPLPGLQDVEMEFSGNGKLVKLVDRLGRGILRYTDLNSDRLEFLMHKKSSGVPFEIIY